MRPSIFPNRRLVSHPKTSVQYIDNTPRIYSANPSEGRFQQGSLDSSRPAYTSLDIATDDYGHPIAISALRFQYDKQNQVRVIDNYQRYYHAHNWDMRATQIYHNYTSAALKDLRRQQHANYGRTYNQREVASLRKYLENSIIIGHGIQQFDLNNLFPRDTLPNSTIDLRAASRNLWPEQKSTLKDVFRRVTGSTMEQQGLLPSDPFASALANIVLLDKMKAYGGEFGKALHYVMNEPLERQLVEKDPYIEQGTMVAKGTYRDQYARYHLSEVYMTESELEQAIQADIENNLRDTENNPGISEVPIPTDKYEEADDDDIITQAALDAVQWAKRLQKQNGGQSLQKKLTQDFQAPLLQNDVASQELLSALNQFNNYKRLGLIQQIASAKSQESITALARAAGYGSEGKTWGSFVELAATMKEAKEQERKQGYFARIGGYERRGMLTEEQASSLRSLTGSYEDLIDATEEVIDANKRLRDIYQSIANIKPYNINQYIEAARGQWKGITGAAHGLVPSFVLNPISRLGSAAFNAVDRSIAPWNAVQRAWNSGVGNAITGTAWALGGPVAGGIASAAVGGLNAVSQGIGNYRQAQLEMRGLQIQNTLNTLGALVSWIATPFQLLHKATKLLTGSFSGLTLKLNNIMSGGIGDMARTGNPLEPLTGVGYTDYLKTTLLDRASLLGAGSTNTAIENMAKMQRDLYRFGKVDTNKLLAANMLGVFNEAFTPTTDSEGAYYNMANKILNNMQGQTASQQADTLYYATQLDSSLAQTLRSALMLGVTDVRSLTNASAFHDMYWRPIGAGEEQRFRRTQFEYGAATQQFGFSKMRFADMLWNSIGRDIYNGLNRLVDAAAGGNWKQALEEGKGIWETFKETLSTVWKDIGGPEKLGSWKDSLKGIWSTAKEGIWTVARGVIDVWHQIFGIILEKAQGLISYLSTIQLAPTWKDGKLGFNISSVRSAQPTRASNDISRAAPIYDDKGRVMEGMEGYDTLLTAMGVRGIDRRFMTKEDAIRKALNAGAISLPEYGIKDLDLGLHPELFAPLVDYLNIAQQGGPGFWKQAARSFSQIPERYWDENYLNTTGLIDIYNKAVNEVNGILDTAGAYFGTGTGEKQKYTIDLTLDGNKAASVTYEPGKGISVSAAPTTQQFNMKNGYIAAINNVR